MQHDGSSTAAKTFQLLLSRHCFARHIIPKLKKQYNNSSSSIGQESLSLVEKFNLLQQEVQHLELEFDIYKFYCTVRTNALKVVPCERTVIEHMLTVYASILNNLKKLDFVTRQIKLRFRPLNASIIRHATSEKMKRKLELQTMSCT